MRKERTTGLVEYIAEEIVSRKKFSSSRILKSKTSYFAVKRLYECKSSADLDKLRALRDEDMADAVKSVLSRLAIKDMAGLREWAKEVESNAETLAQLQANGRQGVNAQDFKALLRIKERTPAASLLAVLWRFSVKCSDDYPAKKGLVELLEIIHPNDIGRLYKILLLELAPVSKDDEPESDKAESRDSTKLEAQFEELKAELESAYIRLNASEEKFERFQQESAELAVVDVLEKMNSQECDMLLDQFARSEQTLKQLSASGYSVPKELSSVSLCVRMFMRTMRNVFMISPVHSIGERLSLTLEQAERYDYSGSDFVNADDVKTVEVISPGWRHGKDIFSLPKVIECRE